MTIAPTANPVLADAVAKGVFILGPDKGMALVERIPDVEAVIVGCEERGAGVVGAEGQFVLLAPPTDAP